MLAIAWKEMIQARRDRLTMGMMVGLPIIQLLLFGYAINTDVRNIATVIYDQDHSAESRGFVRRMEATGFYDVVGHVDGYEQIGVALRSREAMVALVVPPRFGAEVEAGRTAQLQLVVDGSDPQVVASATDTAMSLASARSSVLSIERLQRLGQPAAMPSQVITVEPATWYNPDLRTPVFIVPGLVGVILTMTLVMFTAMAIARERERGTLEQLIVSPIRSAELTVGKLLPYIGVGYLQMSLVLGVGSWVFDVPIVGSLGLLYLLSVFFIAASLAVGLLFSTLAKTQQQAMQMSFFFLLPNILLSGFMFPWEAMPAPARWLSTILPLTHYLRVIRGIVLKGASLEDLRAELIWLAGLTLFLIIAVSLRFQKKLD
ncbi:MAG: ABC transporter permease [Deltaproteobacteria bacterium]|nr:ABC transporter permease [Deltaproteobacteria bacterium]